MQKYKKIRNTDNKWKEKVMKNENSDKKTPIPIGNLPSFKYLCNLITYTT